MVGFIFSLFDTNTMGPKLFKVPSNCLLISCTCWFALIIKVWGFLANSRAPITDDDNLSNKNK